MGGLETAEPVVVVIAPVGSTAMVVLRRYKEMGMVPSWEMAGLMVAAILSDTMLLKSPPTTSEDVAAVEYLGDVLGEDPMAFGIRMYNAKFDIAITCPIAATEYAFDPAFAYLELADFAPEQVETFVHNWFWDRDESEASPT